MVTRYVSEDIAGNILNDRS